MQRKYRSFRYWIGRIHLWLGLASGLIVVIVAITGCLFAFQKEVSEALAPDLFFVKKTGMQTLPVSQLLSRAQEALGTHQPVNFITTYKEPERTWEFMTYQLNDSALTYFGAIDYFRAAYVDPYTGEVRGVRDYKTDFFNVVKYLHWSLLLNTRYGQPIVGWSTLIFVILLITGLVLWWPKRWNKKNRNLSFTVRWKARFKKLNYDLHNVLGFYTLLIALVLGLTGMVWSFTWFEKAVYAVVDGNAVSSTNLSGESKFLSDRKQNAGLDLAFVSVQRSCPNADRISLVPAPVADKGVIYATAYRGKEVYYDGDDMIFDQYSGAWLGTKTARQHTRGERLIAMNYDIHVGAIGGITGKIIACLVSLVAGSLPITGFYIWWGKRKPATKKNPVKQRQPQLAAL